MKTVTIRFSGDIEIEDIYPILATEESGIKLNPRPPLHSELGDVIAVVGVVLNVAQLAASLYQIKLEKSKSGVRVTSQDGSSQEVEGESAKEIEDKLKGLLKD